MLVKEFKPKYKKIELIIHKNKEPTLYEIIAAANKVTMINFDEVLDNYKNYEVSSWRNYEDTKTTSLIIRKLVED